MRRQRGPWVLVAGVAMMFFTLQAMEVTAIGALAAIYNTATNVPVTASSYTATGNTVSFTLNFAPATGATLMVVKNTGLGFINGTFSNLTQGQLVPLSFNGVTYNFVANYYGGNGNDLVLQWANIRPVAWGMNGYGELGNGIISYTGVSVPLAVETVGALSGRTVIAVATGWQYSLALCSDGTLAAWGYNELGELGNNTMSSSLVPVTVDTSGVLVGKTVIAVVAGSEHTLALCSDGTVAAWGYNVHGQLGNNSTTQSNVPVAVSTAGVLSGKTVIAVAAGIDHSLALCSDGTLAAWGYNFSGQLGNNSTANSLVPVSVNKAGVLAGKTVIAMAAGYEHTLALCSDGTLAAWGSNGYGQLGNNSTTQSNVPVAVNTSGVLSGKTVTAVASGEYHSLALCSDGTLAAWGDNTYGELGNNSTAQSNVPVAVNTAGVLAGKTVNVVSAGGRQSLALCLDGTLAAWGYNGEGELGNNSTTNNSVPVAVSTASLATGERFVLAASGSEAYHSLGMVASAPLPTTTSLAATSVTDTGAILNGTVNANNNSTAVSFDYGLTTSYGTHVAGTPTPVTGSIDTAVNAALTGLTPGTTYHYRVSAVSIVDTSNGSDLTFTTLSNNANLANLTLSSGSLSPSFASGTTGYTASVPDATTSLTVTPIAADAGASITVNGTPVASGSASGDIALSVGPNTVTTIVSAQDGITTQTYTLIVTRPPLSAIYNAATDVPVTASSYTATGNTVNFTLNYAPTTGTTLTVVNNTGLGFIQGTFSNLTPGQLVPLSFNGVTYNFVANYYGGSGNDLVLQWANTRLVAWGYGGVGELGNNTQANSLVPVAVNTSGVLLGKTIVAMAAGNTHSLALCSDGTLAAWGDNSFGQLGNGTTTQSLVPTALNMQGELSGRTIVAVSAGDSHSLALCSDGTVVAWGYNFYGQLGNNSTTQSNVPVVVNTATVLPGKIVVAVSAGANFNLALCSDGTLAAWGYNSYGELGTNAAGTQSNVPVLVNPVGALSGRSIIAVSAGGFHSLALCSDGTVAAWGYNYYGALGDGSVGGDGSPVPVPVAVSTAGVLSGQTVTAISAGGTHSLALCADGTLAAWGHNPEGQLGTGNNLASSVPLAVVSTGPLPGRTVSVLEGASGHSLALCSDGTLAAWGYDHDGELGNNSTTDSALPVAVNLASLAPGEHIMAITTGPSAGHSFGLVASPLPVGATLAATSITGTSATLNGTVNASNNNCTVSFEYGTSASYGTYVTGSPSPVSGSTATAVSVSLSGLTPGTAYHYRVNGGGGPSISNGSDLTFTTLSNDASLSSLALSAGTLSPVFASGTTSYAVSVPNSVTSVTLTPVTHQANATMTVNSTAVTSGSASGGIDLRLGANNVTVLV